MGGSRFVRCAAVAALVLLIAAASGSGATSDGPLPDSITTPPDVTLAPEASTTFSDQVLHLAPAPPKADILLAFDTTGSMGQAIADAQADAASIVSQIRASIGDAQFAVADFKDYPISPYGNSTDYPYRLDRALTSDGTAVQAAIAALSAGGGNDKPEAYNRLFYEAYHDPAIGFRADAPHFVVVLGDSWPHDPAQQTDFPSCLNATPADPGPDGNPSTTADNLATMATLTALKQHNTNVSFVTYNPSPLVGTTGPTNADCQKELAAFTGGTEVTHATGTSALGQQIVDLINGAAAKIDTVTFKATVTGGGFDVPADASNWVSFFPPLPYGPASAPADLTFDETVTVPKGMAPGVYTLHVDAIADGAVRSAGQTFHVTVGQQAVSALAMTADQRSNVPGIAQIPLGSIPADRIPVFAGAPTTASGGSLPGGSIPGGSIPGGSIPGGSIPGGSIPGGSIPGGSITFGDIGLVGSVPGGSIPGGSIPGGSIPGGSIGLQNALQSVLLSQIPLTGPASEGATWPQVLSGSGLDGRPLNTITLYDVSQDSTAWQNLARLPLRDVPFATSLWGGVPVAAWLLGNSTLDQIGPPPRFTSWSAALTAAGGSATGVDTAHNTVFGVAIAGQLGSTDIGSIPGGSIPGGSIPGGSIPGGSIPAGNVPARAILLRSLNIAGSRLASVRLADIKSSNGTGTAAANDLVNCSATGLSCTTGTLADAARLGSIRADATYGALLDRVAATNPAAQMTISELIFAFLPQSLYPWEQIDLQGLQDVAGSGKNVDYHVDFDLACSLTSSFTIRAKLPSGEFVVPGSSSVVYGLAAQQPAQNPTYDNDTNRFSWTTSSGAGALPAGVCPTGTTMRHVRLNFSAYERLAIGEHTAGANVDAAGQTWGVSNRAPVFVTQTGEPNDDTTTAQAIQKDTLYVGHIAYSGDTDTFKFPLGGYARGTKIKVFLKVPQSPAADLDVVLAKPNAPGVRSTPGGSIPGGSIPIEEQPASVDNSNTPLPPDTLSDVPQSTPGGSIPGGSIPGGSIPGGSIPGGSIPGGSISANRGTASEAAQIVTNGETGDAEITVSGYNGASSTAPYVLRLQVTPPPTLPPCPAVQGLSGTGAPAPGVLPSVASVVAAHPNAKTLFLVNRQRMAGLYDGTNSTSIDTLLNTPGSWLNLVASRPEVDGVVLPIDGDPNVRTAYQNWDASPCSIDAVNNVVQSIDDVIAQYKAQLTSVKYVVVLGNDTVIPFWRQYDRVAISPEIDEANELENFTSDSRPANPIFAAAAQNYVLTNGAYGARSRITWLGSDVPLPQDSVSRFVESTDDISAQLQQYNGTSGILDPKSEFSSGDSFFSDSAQAADLALQRGFPTAAATHLYPPGDAGWTKQNFLDAFFNKQDATGTAPVSAVPDIGALYAHYNPWLAQPAGPMPFTALSQLLSTADAAGPTSVAADLRNKILFTIGCHSGLNIPNDYPLLTGSTATKRDWAETYGKAGAATYIANTGFGYDDTDSIAMSGRLMWLFAQKLNRGTASIGEQWTDALDTYYRTAGDWDVLDEKVMLEATFYGPPWAHFASAQPTTAPAPPALGAPETHSDGSTLQIAPLTINSPNLTQHGNATDGVWWDADGQTLSVPNRPIQPLISRNVTQSGLHAHDAFITSLNVNDVTNVKPVLAHPIIENPAYEPLPNFAAIFWPAAPTTVLHSPSGDTLNVVLGQYRPHGATGTERQIVSLGAEIGYTTGSDDVRPLIRQVGAVMTSGSSAHIFVTVTDESGHLGKVAALYNDGPGNFKYVDLARVGTTDTYAADVTGLAAAPEVIGEARDWAGNVAMSANKAENYTATTDTGAPAIVIDSPLAGASFSIGQQQRATFRCSDPGGVASCVGTVANGAFVDTSTPGSHDFKVTATDATNHTTSTTVQYYVRFGFSGFKSPVDNPPVLNVVKGGNTVPVKWSLKNLAGNYVRSLGSVTSISSSPIRCPSATTDPDPDTAPGGLAGLKYDTTAEQFVYNWSTLKSWSGSCRRLYVKFSDLTVPYADFQFK